MAARHLRENIAIGRSVVESVGIAHNRDSTRRVRPRLPKMPIPDRKYGDIANDLDELVSYLTRLRVEPLDRIRLALANIRQIDMACSQGRTAALELERDPRLPELIWSLVEGAEFSEIFHGIRGYDEAVVRRLMRKAVNGPVDPRMETQNSNEPRNTLFELRLGAALHAAGASITLGGLADLVVDHVGFRLYVECKRPLGEHNTARRADEACSQLRARFDADSHPNAVGMVAISTSRSLNAGGNKMLFVKRESDIEPSLTRDLQRIYDSHCSAVRTQVDPRIIGVICHVFTPVLVQTTRRLIAASQFDIFLGDHLGDVLPVTGDKLKALLDRVRGGAQTVGTT